MLMGQKMKKPENFYTRRIMDEESCELRSVDDKALLENNKRRTFKTHAQLQALESFYDENKYPTEAAKILFAESIGLTEKQVSGWFSYRRLKDRRIRLDRSSGGVIQRQDSCGSTKLGDDKYLDTREVESGRVTLLEYSGNHNSRDYASSGSSHSGDHFDVPSSRYLAPKAPMDVKVVKTKPGPSGYLKVKGNIENDAITAVKRLLAKNYRVDGPPLGIEFDPLPPGAFEPVDETYYTEEAVLMASPDISKIHQHPKFGKGCEYNSSMGPRNPNIDRTIVNTTQGPNIPNYYIHQKFRKNTSFVNDGAYNLPWMNSMEVPEGVDIMRMDSISSNRHLQPYGVKENGERENRFHKHNGVNTKISCGENIENGSFNLSMKGYEYNNSLDKVQHRELSKDGRAYAERRMVNENRVRFPFKNDIAVPKRVRDEYYQQQYRKRLSMMDNQPGTCRVTRCGGKMASSFSEDEQSAETSCSVG